MRNDRRKSSPDVASAIVKHRKRIFDKFSPESGQPVIKRKTSLAVGGLTRIKTKTWKVSRLLYFSIADICEDLFFFSLFLNSFSVNTLQRVDYEQDSIARWETNESRVNFREKEIVLCAVQSALIILRAWLTGSSLSFLSDDKSYVYVPSISAMQIPEHAGRACSLAAKSVRSYSVHVPTKWPCIPYRCTWHTPLRNRCESMSCFFNLCPACDTKGNACLRDLETLFFGLRNISCEIFLGNSWLPGALLGNNDANVSNVKSSFIFYTDTEIVYVLWR